MEINRYFVVNTNYMSIAELRAELHEYVDSSDKKLLHMLQALVKAYLSEDYTLPGEPMTKEEFIGRIRKAKANVAAGKFTTQEDLEREVEEW